ncbi:MAG: neutral/alkaline non-lysosomal ceramidase N-terminal domain-containing protein [Pirellulaceae bacterium]
MGFVPFATSRWKPLVHAWWLIISFSLLSHLTAAETLYQIGLGRADITPDFPVRLSGFGGRREEATLVRQPLWAKAMAFRRPDGSFDLLVTVDSLGVSDAIRQRLKARLLERQKAVASITIAASHTHSAPMLEGICPTLFGEPIPQSHQTNIQRYTKLFEEGLTQAVEQAIADCQVARLESLVTQATFATNRRTPGGPVDHDLPVLVVRRPDGQVRAIFTSYACHCVTLSDNQISGDWAGYAQESIERAYPGILAMVAIGCGADANPSSGVTGDRFDEAQKQGLEIADAIRAAMTGAARDVEGELSIDERTVELPLQNLPPRATWEQLAQRSDPIGHHARVQLGKIDQGQRLIEAVPYRIVCWRFGESLAWLFLPGEVVVDYATRWKQQYDAERLWVHGYSNDSPGYVPSERILREGGYEGGGAMIYYDIPMPYAPGLEDKIVQEANQMIPAVIQRPFDPARTQGSLPRTAQRLAASCKVQPRWQVELVAAEPQVIDPVAIDIGPDGKLWVAQMQDYPDGIQGRPEGGGSIQLLQDLDADGSYESSHRFADGLPFPTGVKAWRNGVLVCAAPSVLYLEDTDGDGHADITRTLLTGFGTDNFQARVNSLEIDLDGWLVGSCGLFGGSIRSFQGQVLELGDRDFRFDPDTGSVMPETGRSQQGRVRDCFGRWFGCDNSDLGRYYPIPHRYLARNPHVPIAASSTPLAIDPEVQRLFPRNPNAQRFRLSGALGRATAACGIGVYRDNLLGDDLQHDLLTCEPVNLLVHRMDLQPMGPTLIGKRETSEEESEFLASDDPWFRPVQARTGPDGGLWVVDMSRYVIEHTRWIPPEDLAGIDPRAGDTLGRILRVVPKDGQKRLVRNWMTAPLPDLLDGLNTPNGWQRDAVSQVLRWNWISRSENLPLSESDRNLISAKLKQLLANSQAPVRIQAAYLLADVGSLNGRDLARLMSDPEAHVRRAALVLAEPGLREEQEVPAEWIQLANDPDPAVRLQWLLSAGEATEAESTVPATIVRQIVSEPENPWLTTAALSSIHPRWLNTLFHVTNEQLETVAIAELPASWLIGLAKSAAGWGRSEGIGILLSTIDRRLQMEANWESRQALLNCWFGIASNATSGSLDPLITNRMLAIIRERIADQRLSLDERKEAMRWVGILKDSWEGDLQFLKSQVQIRNPLALEGMNQAAGIRRPETAQWLLDDLKDWTPAMQSAAFNLLLGYRPWQQMLGEAVFDKRLEVSLMSPEQQLSLLAAKDTEGEDASKAWRTRLKESFASGSAAASSASWSQTHRSALTASGNPTRGAQVYQEHCAACHQLAGKGHSVGPSLDAVVSKPRQYLWQEILDPNRNRDRRYEQFVAESEDGSIDSGILEETPTSITLRQASGKSKVILRSELVALKSTNRSLMPEGMDRLIAPQQLADLLEFLQRQQLPWKVFEGNRPKTIAAKVLKPVALRAAEAEIRGKEILFESPFQNVGYWHHVEDSVSWSLQTEVQGSWDLYLEYSCASQVDGQTLSVSIGEHQWTSPIAQTGQWSDYQSLKIGTVDLNAADHRVVLQAGSPLRGPLIDLRAVHLVPAGMAWSPPGIASDLPEEVAEVAEQLLAPGLDPARRQRMIDSFWPKTDQILHHWSQQQPWSAEDQVRWIPTIWMLTNRACKSGDQDLAMRILDEALPRIDGTIDDWRVVVLGGGVVGGLSDSITWPRPVIENWMESDAQRIARCQRVLMFSIEKAADEKTSTGTRYDALRLVGMLPEEQVFSVLDPYWNGDVHEELRMGAISAASDIDSPQSVPLLSTAAKNESGHLRSLAIDGLLRTQAGRKSLVEELRMGNLPADALTAAQHERLQKP